MAHSTAHPDLQLTLESERGNASVPSEKAHFAAQGTVSWPPEGWPTAEWPPPGEGWLPEEFYNAALWESS